MVATARTNDESRSRFECRGKIPPAVSISSRPRACLAARDPCDAHSPRWRDRCARSNESRRSCPADRRLRDDVLGPFYIRSCTDRNNPAQAGDAARAAWAVQILTQSDVHGNGNGVSRRCARDELRMGAHHAAIHHAGALSPRDTAGGGVSILSVSRGILDLQKSRATLSMKSSARATL